MSQVKSSIVNMNQHFYLFAMEKIMVIYNHFLGFKNEYFHDDIRKHIYISVNSAFHMQ